MISIRQLLIIALVIAGLWLLGRLRHRLVQGRLKRRVQRNKASYKETMRCQRCGVYLPRPGTIEEDNYICDDDKCPVRRINVT